MTEEEPKPDMPEELSELEKKNREIQQIEQDFKEVQEMLREVISQASRIPPPTLGRNPGPFYNKRYFQTPFPPYPVEKKKNIFSRFWTWLWT